MGINLGAKAGAIPRLKMEEDSVCSGNERQHGVGKSHRQTRLFAKIAFRANGSYVFKTFSRWSKNGDALINWQFFYINWHA